MKKLDRILSIQEKNKILAGYIGYEYHEETKTLYNDERVTDIHWIPEHDYNQLFWILEKLCKNEGYNYTMMDNIFEVCKKDTLIVSRQEKNIRVSIYEGLFAIINDFKNK